jgi:DNA-directed RNA polymerase
MALTAGPAPLAAALLEGTDMARQIEHEQRAIADGYQRQSTSVLALIDRGAGGRTKTAEAAMSHWLPSVLSAIHATFTPKGEDHTGRGVLTTIGARPCAALAMSVVLSSAMGQPGGFALTAAAAELAELLHAELAQRILRPVYRVLVKELDATDPQAASMLRRRTLALLASGDRRRLIKAASRNRDAVAADERHVEKVGLIRVSLLLIDAVLQGATVATPAGESAPALVTASHVRHTGRRTVTFTAVVPTPRLVQLLQDDLAFRCTGKPLRPVMLCPPVDWGDARAGGYINIRAHVMANQGPRGRAFVESQDLTVPLRRLSVMARTPFSINQSVLAAYEALTSDLSNRRGTIDAAGNWKCDLPCVPPSSYPPLPAHPLAATIDGLDRAAYLKTEPGIAWARSPQGRDFRRTYQRWEAACNDHKSAVAASFYRDTEVRSAVAAGRFWMPRRVDFRGRANPLPSHLSTHGDDLTRAMLLFGDPVPLDAHGHRELSIHAANTYGHGWDKAPLDVRATFVEQHRDTMLSIAQSPATDRRWMAADETWQFLAACAAVADPAIAERLPCQRDGSCNGLQWYALLCRDPVAARATNLISTGQRMSAYADVAARAKALLAASGSPLLVQMAAECDEKMLKPPVMTVFYGVTDRTMLKQLAGELTVKRRWGYRDAYAAAHEAVPLIRRAIADAYPLPTALLAWFRACAGLIAAGPPGQRPRLGQAVTLHTPGWWPLYPERYRARKDQIKVIGHKFNLRRNDEAGPIDRGYQVRATPAHIIHRFDAEHFARTCEVSYKAGIDCTGVFDSYWFHASNVRLGLPILLEKMVEVASELTPEAIAEHWRETFPYADIPSPPAPGRWDIREALGSVYAFS